MSQKIRIKLKSYDHNLVDKSAEKIVKTVKSTGAVVSGPVPLPTQKQIFTVNRSTFVNKKAREQFQLSTFKRILDIYRSWSFLRASRLRSKSETCSGTRRPTPRPGQQTHTPMRTVSPTGKRPPRGKQECTHNKAFLYTTPSNK